MKKIILSSVAFFLFLGSIQAQIYYQPPRGDGARRTIDPGKGQLFNKKFYTNDVYYFVQFAVYSPSKDWRNIKGPSNIGIVWLIFHYDTYIKGRDMNGAYYIVKPFESATKAKAYAERYKKMGYDCFFNPELTGSKFELRASTLE
ncbi:MAG: hypothetical protein AAFR87_10090 [Bacteroidota bacterium]